MFFSGGEGSFLTEGTTSENDFKIYNNCLNLLHSTLFTISWKLNLLYYINLSSNHPMSGNPDSGIREIFTCGIGFLDFGIRNTAQGIIRDPTNDWNLELEFHWQRRESWIHGVESRIQECHKFLTWGESKFATVGILLPHTRFSAVSHSSLGLGLTPCTLCILLNPLSPVSDQHEISPCTINAFLNRMIMRIEDMITQEELHCYFKKFFPLLLLKMYRERKWEFAFWY